MIVFWCNGVPHCSFRRRAASTSATSDASAAACSCNLVLKYGFKVDSRQFTILAAIQFPPSSADRTAKQGQLPHKAT